MIKGHGYKGREAGAFALVLFLNRLAVVYLSDPDSFHHLELTRAPFGYKPLERRLEW